MKVAIVTFIVLAMGEALRSLDHNFIRYNSELNLKPFGILNRIRFGN